MTQQFSPITLGARLKTIDAAGFILTETTHQSNHKLGPHRHELANIAFTLDGSYLETINERRFECKPQSMVIKPAGEAHSNEYGQVAVRCLLIEVKAERLESLHPLSEALKRVEHLRESKLSILARRICREISIGDSASSFALEGLSLETIAYLSRDRRLSSEVRVPRWLERVREILHAHFSESLILGEIAKTVDMHPVHVARSFRKFYGCSPGEYVRELRIQHACRALSTTSQPLIEIALESGFADQAHFCRAFKRHTGVTPTEFRALNSIPRTSG